MVSRHPSPYTFLTKSLMSWTNLPASLISLYIHTWCGYLLWQICCSGCQRPRSPLFFLLVLIFNSVHCYFFGYIISTKWFPWDTVTKTWNLRYGMNSLSYSNYVSHDGWVDHTWFYQQIYKKCGELIPYTAPSEFNIAVENLERMNPSLLTWAFTDGKWLDSI